MGRIRTIKPEFFTHIELFDLEKESGLPIRIAYAGLWTCCDREGRFKWRPRELKLAALPYDEADFSRVLDALASRGFVVKYTSGGDSYGHIPSWKRHQFVNNKESQSTIPEPPCHQQLDASLSRDDRVDDARGTCGVKERKGMEGNGASGTRDSKEKIAPEMIARGVLTELRLSGKDLLSVLEGVCEAELTLWSSPDTLRDALIAAGSEYEQAKRDGKFTVYAKRPVNFFGDGDWRNKSCWPWKEGNQPPALTLLEKVRLQTQGVN